MGEGASVLVSFPGRFPSQAHISRTPRLEKLVQKRVAVYFLQGFLGQMFICTLEGKGAFGWGGGLGDGDVGLCRFAGREGGAGGGCCERLGRGVETSLASRGWRLSSWESPQGGSLKVAEVMRTQSAHTGESLLSEASGFPDLSSPAAGTGSGLPAGQRLPAHQGDWQELLDL